MTEEAIRQLIEQENYIPGVNRITPSMRKAIDKIKDGNVSTDLGTDFFVSEAHATEETFSGVQHRLQGNLSRLILYLADRGSNAKPDNLSTRIQFNPGLLSRLADSRDNNP